MYTVHKDGIVLGTFKRIADAKACLSLTAADYIKHNGTFYMPSRD